MSTINSKRDKPKEKTLLEGTREIFQTRLNELLNQRGWNIPKLLKKIELTDDANNAIGLSNSQLYKCLSESYEGFPNMEVAILIAHVFGVSLGYLLGHENIHYEKVGEVNGVDLLIKREKPTNDLTSKYAQTTKDIFILRATLDFTNTANPCSLANVSSSEYILVDGVLYQDEYSPNNALGFNFSIYEYINNLANETSYVRDLTYDTADDIYKLSEAARHLKDGIRQIRKTHRLIRGYLGAFGTLSADNYMLLCYLLGHNQQT